MMSPFILPISPRNARDQCKPVADIAFPTAGNELPPVVEDREGVAVSPLGGK